MFRYANIILMCCFLHRVRGVECSCEASKWLTDVLGTHCKLIRKNPLFQRIAKEHTKSKGNHSHLHCALLHMHCSLGACIEYATVYYSYIVLP